jgi:hypothetical protein
MILSKKRQLFLEDKYHLTTEAQRHREDQAKRKQSKVNDGKPDGSSVLESRLYLLGVSVPLWFKL